MYELFIVLEKIFIFYICIVYVVAVISFYVSSQERKINCKTFHIKIVAEKSQQTLERLKDNKDRLPI